jgi:hypothetical protein
MTCSEELGAHLPVEGEVDAEGLRRGYTGAE